MIYYLDGIEKKGPLTKEEIKILNLNTETLVYSDEWGNWKKIKELPELLNYLSEVDINKKESSIESNKNESEIIIKPFFVYLILFLLALTLAFVTISIQKKLDYKEMSNKIDNYFGDNQSIADFNFDAINGEFRKLKKGTLLKDIFTDDIGFEKEIHVYNKNDYSPTKTEIFKIVANAKKYKDWDKIVDYFDVESKPTTRNLSILRKETDDKFTFNVVTFLDMAYLVPEYTLKNFGFDVKVKYSNYRPSINMAYNNAALYLIENKGATHVRESENKIWSFPDIESEFYKIENLFPKYQELPSGDLLKSYSERVGNENLKIYNMEAENGDYTYLSFMNKESMKKYEESYQLTYNRYMTDNASIYDDKSIVWYCEMTNRYQIEEKEYVFYKQILIYTILIFVILNIIYFIRNNKKRIKFL